MQDTSAPVAATPLMLPELPRELWHEVTPFMRNSAPLLRVRKKKLVDCVSVTVRKWTSVEGVIRGLNAILQRGTTITNFYWDILSVDDKVGPEEIQTLAPLVKHCKRTEIYAYVKNDAALSNVMAVLDTMVRCDFNLAGLKMIGDYHNAIRDEGMQQLAPILANFGELKKLSLHRHYITGVGLALLKDALAFNQDLAVLRLSHNDFRFDAGGLSIACIIEQHTRSLHVLYLEWCNLGDADALLIAKNMQSCTVIKEVSLPMNRLTNTGALHFSQTLLHCPSLTTLNLSDNCIEDTGALSFVPVLQEHGALTLLDLRRNHISAAGENALRHFPPAAVLPQVNDDYYSD